MTTPAQRTFLALMIVAVAGLSGYVVSLHQRSVDWDRLSDHQLYAAEVEIRLTRLSELQAEFLHRQTQNRENIAANTAAIARNSERMEMLCMALLKKACVP